MTLEFSCIQATGGAENFSKHDGAAAYCGTTAPIRNSEVLQPEVRDSSGTKSGSGQSVFQKEEKLSENVLSATGRRDKEKQITCYFHGQFQQRKLGTLTW